MSSKKIIGKAACAALAMALSSSCIAAANDAAFPQKQIEIIVTFPPGGGTDMLARLIGNYLTQDLGQTVIVENRPGASGNVGARIISERAPDGYSLLIANSSYAINPAVFSNMPFDPKKDLSGVVNFAYVPSVLIVPADSPYKTLGDLVKAATPASNPTFFGSCGNGTPQHLAGELLNIAAKTHIAHVPYKGCGPALNDVLGNQVTSAIVTASSAIPHIKAGKVRALGVTAKERSQFLPDVPTVAEQGYPGYELNQWHGFLVPARTPDAVKEKLYAAVAKVMKREDVQKKLAGLGYSIANDGPAAFDAIVQNDIDRFTKLAKEINLNMN